MKRCPNCKRVYDDSQIYCLEDGTLLTEDASSDSIPTLLLPREKSRLPFVLVGLLLLVAASVGGWFLLGAKQQSASQNNKQADSLAQMPTPMPTLSPVATSTPTPVQVFSPSPAPTAAPEMNISNTSETAVNSKSTETAVNSKPSETTAAKPPPQPPPIMKAEDHQIAFALQQCRKSGTSITCDFLLTNKGQDRWFELVAWVSNLYDESGNGYKGKNAQIANQQGSEPRIAFVSGVVTKAQITFEGIEPSATKITLLQIQYDVGDDTALQLRLRNVPLIVSR